VANLNIAIQIAAQDQASGPIGRITNALGGLKNSAQQGWSGLQNVATVAGGALVGGVGLATGAIVGLGAASLGAFTSFEEQMNEVFTLLPGISQTAMDQMTGQVEDFSKEFGKLPNEVVPALYQAISAGVPPDNVFEFLETSQKAAIGGVTELETAVDGISSVVNAYGSDVISAAQASDLMFTAVKQGKTDFTQLSQSLFNVIPTASALNVAFGDVTAGLATMTAQGTPTSVATTQMRQLLVELSKAGGATAKVFEETAGVSFKEFIAQGGNVQGALAIMEQAAGESGVGINDLFGSVEAGNAALALTGKGADSFANNLAQMAGSAGATEAAFDTMNQGLGRSIERLKSFGATALLQIGESLSPLADSVLDLAEEALPALQNILDTAVVPAIETVAEQVGMFINNVVAGQDPLGAFTNLLVNLVPADMVGTVLYLTNDVLPRLSDWFANNVQPIVDFVTEFVSWQDVLIAFGAVVASVALPALYGIVTAAAPVIAVGALLVGAIALARNAWENDWLGIQTAVSNAITTLQPYWDQLQTILNQFWQEIIPALQEVWQTLIGVWQTELQPALAELWAALGELFEALGFGTGEVDFLSVALGALKIGLDLVVLVVKGLSPIIEIWGNTVSIALGYVTDLVKSVVSLKEGLDKVLEPLGRVASAIGDMIEEALGMPDWLIPGSPTPFEIGLRGIGSAIDQMPPLTLAPSGALPALAGAGGGVALAGAGTTSTGGGIVIERIEIVANSEEEGRAAGRGVVDELRKRGLL